MCALDSLAYINMLLVDLDVCFLHGDAHYLSPYVSQNEDHYVNYLFVLQNDVHYI